MDAEGLFSEMGAGYSEEIEVNWSLFKRAAKLKQYWLILMVFK